MRVHWNEIKLEGEVALDFGHFEILCSMTKSIEIDCGMWTLRDYDTRFEESSIREYKTLECIKMHAGTLSHIPQSIIQKMKHLIRVELSYEFHFQFSYGKLFDAFENQEDFNEFTCRCISEGIRMISDLFVIYTKLPKIKKGARKKQVTLIVQNLRVAIEEFETNLSKLTSGGIYGKPWTLNELKDRFICNRISIQDDKNHNKFHLELIDKQSNTILTIKAENIDFPYTERIEDFFQKLI